MMGKKGKGINSLENESSVEIENGADKQNSRRNILKQTLAGGAVITAGVASSKWSKPVIDSVVLPAHAETSTPGGGSGGGTTASPSGGTTTVTPTTTALPTTTTAIPTTTTTTTTTTLNPNSNTTTNFTFFDWTDNIA